MSKFIYVLAQPNYFMQGDRGRVTHALGVITGLVENNVSVTVLTGSGFDTFMNRFDDLDKSLINYEEVKSDEKDWYLKLFDRIKDVCARESAETLIVRYKSSKLRFLNRVSKLCNHSGINSVLEVNSFYFNYKRITIKERIIKTVLKPLEFRTISKFDNIYVVSDTLKKIILKKNNEVNVLVIPNASSPRSIDSEICDSPLRLVYLGKLGDYYDIESIIKVIMSNDNVLKIPLDIYGDGPLKSKLETIADNHQLITFHGRYNNDDLNKIVKRPNDIFILPYKSGTVAEIGSPTKLFEYMALKSPIISSMVGQARKIVIEGKTGYIYKEPLEILRIIDEKLNDKKSRLHMSENAYNDLIMNHTWKNRMKSLIEGVTNEK